MTSRRAWVFLFFAVSLGAAGLLLSRQWSSLADVLATPGEFEWRLQPAWLTAALVLATFNLFLMGSVWVRLYRALGGAIGLMPGVRVWMVTNMGRYIPGKIWQLAGLAAYLKSTRGQGSSGLLSAVVFQLVGLATGASVAAAVLGAKLGSAFGMEGKGPVLGAVALAVCLTLLLNPSLVERLTRWTAARMREDVEVRRLHWSDLLGAGGGLLVAWGVYGLGLRALLEGVGWSAAPGALELAGVFAAAYVVGYLVLFSPGGLVVREGAMAALLVGLTPVSAVTAGAFAVLARIWVTLSELLALILLGGMAGPDTGVEAASIGVAAEIDTEHSK
ncbi:MAG: lysylphosphatidylglycerol synthase domain-containing protein [Gemmatimonadota bacterium]